MKEERGEDIVEGWIYILCQTDIMERVKAGAH